MNTRAKFSTLWCLGAAAAFSLAACGGVDGTATYAEQRAMGMDGLVIEVIPEEELDAETIQRILENTELAPMPSHEGYFLRVVQHELDEGHRVYMTPPQMQPWLIDATYQPPTDEFAGVVPMIGLEVWIRPDEPTMLRRDTMKAPAIPQIRQMIQIWQLPDAQAGPYEVMDPWADDDLVIPVCHTNPDGSITCQPANR